MNVVTSMSLRSPPLPPVMTVSRSTPRPVLCSRLWYVGADPVEGLYLAPLALSPCAVVVVVFFSVCRTLASSPASPRPLLTLATRVATAESASTASASR